PVLLGREPELDALRARVDALAGHRRSAAVTLRGRRGAGLSALLGAAVGHAAAAGVRTVAATCSPAESGLSYGVILQLAAALGEPGARGEREPGCSLPMRPLWAWSSAGPRSPVATAAGLCAEFLAVARRRPLLIAVDDAHWADPESLAWLRAM